MMRDPIYTYAKPARPTRSQTTKATKRPPFLERKQEWPAANEHGRCLGLAHLDDLCVRAEVRGLPGQAVTLHLFRFGKPMQADVPTFREPIEALLEAKPLALALIEAGA